MNICLSDFVTYLEWDSCFFLKKIGSVQDAESFKNNISSMVPLLQKEKYDLVYVFSGLLLSDSFCEQYSMSLVDRKITYECVIKNVSKENNNIIQYNEDPKLLFDLAYQAGHNSRFKIDKRFSNKEFEQLYSEWVVKSVSKECADVVFVYKIDAYICGFITVKKYGDLARIGLFATDARWRRRGVGSALFLAACNYSVKSKIFRLQVTTQDTNSEAKKFYVKQNMSIKELINIYHFWL